tara:strand:+ start:3516 stop:4466 length:951 start_codon:yes stop_codon:yes gene_type:complete
MSKFYGVNNIGQTFLINQLELNMKSFLDNGFLKAGGFVNIHKPVKNIHSNGLYKLYTVNDPNFKTGQVWQPARKDWVFETGVNESFHAPVAITGVYIDSVFHNINTTGNYEYTLDYKNSRVLFAKKQSTSLNVEMSYSYRWVQVYNYVDAKWWQELQYSPNNNEAHQKTRDKGDFTIPAHQRVQMPAVIIETVARGTSEPFRMGDKSMRISQDFLFHIIADNYTDRNNILDILRLQEDKVLSFYDIDKVVKNEKYWLNFDGTLNPKRLQYDVITSLDGDYLWNTCRLKNMVISEVESLNADLFEANIRVTAEIIIV